MELRREKKGMYYAMDALLAGFLLAGTVLLLLNNPFYSSKAEQKNFLSQDIMNSLSSIKIYEISHYDFIAEGISDGNITDPNKTVLDQIGIYWAENKSGNATKLFGEMVAGIIPENKGMRLTIEAHELFNNDYPKKNDVTASTRLISGVMEGEPLRGFSSSAFLRRIRNKKTSSYAHLGGFVGQGNVSFFIERLPGDIKPEGEPTKVLDVILEGDFASNFEFYINGEQCGRTETQNTFTPNTAPMVVDSWNLPHCNDLIEPGRNNFTLHFLGEMTYSYVAGSTLRIDYRTDELQQNITFGESQYFFPGIEGIANLYDSFYVPGELQTMDISLHFETLNNTQTYITIGERIIELDAEGGEQWVTITNEELLNTYNLDYEQLSRNTIPLRFASYNATTEIITGGNADVILITDFSGSMMRAVANWGMGNVGAKCEDVFEDPETRRTNMAKCVDVEFAETILEFPGNRLWPVFIHRDEIKFYNNPEDLEAIEGYINSYPQGRDHICLSCALNQAYDLLDQYSSDNRSKFVVLMTNGVPTHCAGDGCEGTSTSFGASQCPGLCIQSGNCPESLRESQCNQCIANPGAAENTIHSAQRLKDDLNATIFTVGFGPVDECSQAGELLTEVASIANGTYQHSSDIEELRLIYENISYEILERLEQENQTVITNQSISVSRLFWDSHINFTYTPIVSGVQPGRISVTVQEPVETCNASIYIPGEIDVVDARIISYSGMHWSDLLVVKDNVTVFNMSDYYVPYYRLGDPLAIHMPVDELIAGNNTFFVETGDSPENRTGCSPDNSLIYTAMIPAVTSRTDVTGKIEGCTWTVAYEDGDIDEIPVPADYPGGKVCSYQPGNITYDADDAYDIAMYQLLRQLDLTNNTRIFVNINQLDLEIVTTVIGDVPFLWGPARVSLEVWD